MKQNILCFSLSMMLFCCVSAVVYGQMFPQTEGMNVTRDTPYVENGHRNQVLDIYLPEEPSNEPLPLMMWVHGGAWMGGSKSMVPVLYLVDKGFAVASIEHRFTSDAIWPAQAYDCKAAVRFLRANAATYNLDPERFGIGGDSSGGHLAAVIGTSGDVPEIEGWAIQTFPAVSERSLTGLDPPTS